MYGQKATVIATGKYVFVSRQLAPLGGSRIEVSQGSLVGISPPLASRLLWSVQAGDLCWRILGYRPGEPSGVELVLIVQQSNC